MIELAKEVGKPDLIFEATGNAEVCFRAMEVLAHNGALIWTSITGGKHEVTIDAARINLEWVLGNKLLVSSVNGNRRHFELGIQALSHGELTYPGVTEQHPHPPRLGTGSLPGNDASAGGQAGTEGFCQRRRMSRGAVRASGLAEGRPKSGGWCCTICPLRRG